jgi:hypothetical protein
MAGDFKAGTGPKNFGLGTGAGNFELRDGDPFGTKVREAQQRRELREVGERVQRLDQVRDSVEVAREQEKIHQAQVKQDRTEGHRKTIERIDHEKAVGKLKEKLRSGRGDIER